MKRLSAISVAAILAAVCVVQVPAAVLVDASEASADDANVLYRQKIMATIGALMKGLGCVLKKECALDDTAVAQSAMGIIFMTELSDLAFKPTTEGATVKQKARPEVWSEWNKFKIGLEEMRRTAAGVASTATAKRKKNMNTYIQNLGQTCKSCHDTFRTK